MENENENESIKETTHVESSNFEPSYSPNYGHSTEASFKKSKSNVSGGFGKSVFVPFLSGIIGAVLVVGICFGVPSIKDKLFNTNNGKLTTSSDSSASAILNLEDYSKTSTYVAEKVLPSVVGIKINYKVKSFFGTSTAEGAGSGIILTEDGYILTNNHVISEESSSAFYAIQEASDIKVKLYNDDTEYTATVVGTDSYTDLAILKIEKDGLTPAVLGNSDNLKVGEFVFAIGNPLGLDYSVTSGIISALDREVSSDGTTYYAIQTDAAINSGNSGGALVNTKGEVIGINTLKFAGSGIEGVGFAIPISSTTAVIEQLIDHSSVIRPYIGIIGGSVSDEDASKYGLPKGVYVESVEKDSPADKAGLSKGDIITKIEGKDVSSINELNRIKYTYNIGDTVKLSVYREGTEREVEIKLAEMPTEDTSEETKTEEVTTPNTQYYTEDDFDSMFDLFR